MADRMAAPFAMNGARDAIAAGLVHIEQQVAAIEQAVVENPALAFDLARTLVESVCRSILKERGITYSQNDDVPKLFRLVTTNLPLLPPAASGEVEIRKGLDRTISGLNSAIHGICALRNYGGFASHGSDGPRAAMQPVQALLAAGAADTIVGFLYRVHKMDRTQDPSERTLYDDNPEFNASIDELHPIIRIFNEEFLPSRVLFELAPVPYQVHLAEFKSNNQDNEERAGS